MARDIFGNRKITKEDLYTRKRNISNADIRREYYKITIMVLGALFYMYYIIGFRPELWF